MTSQASAQVRPASRRRSPAELGARVALIGHGTIGGTCVNTGCVPSKNLIRATEGLHHAAAAARFGGIVQRPASRTGGQ
jgi:pyruvate/2-oxoglutarate dehydrogenase complex dihydrolipoamide dehydrogenase (E3) component